MKNHNLKVISKLVIDQRFRNYLQENIDNTLCNAGISVDQEFVEKLKEYLKTMVFNRLATSNIYIISDALIKHFQLYSAW